MTARAALGWLGCTGPALLIVGALSVTNAVLVNYHRELFGAWWRHVMWEGGVVELATAVQFLAGAVVFAVAAAASPRRSVRRRWLVVFAVTNLVLLGEETNYGQDMVILDLDAPDFAARYNPQAGNLHNLIPLAFVPVLIFFGGALALRLAYRRVVLRLVLPIPVGFLHAVLLTAVAVPFMDLGDERHLFVDEVYEWSGAALLLLLALHTRWGWFFSSEGTAQLTARDLRVSTVSPSRDPRAGVRLVLQAALAFLIIGGLVAVSRCGAGTSGDCCPTRTACGSGSRATVSMRRLSSWPSRSSRSSSSSSPGRSHRSPAGTSSERWRDWY